VCVCIYIYIYIYIYTHTYISLQYIHISVQYIYLFISNAIKKNKRLTTLVFDVAHSDRILLVLLHKQTHPVSDYWHLKLSAHLALALILSALS